MTPPRHRVPEDQRGDLDLRQFLGMHGSRLGRPPWVATQVIAGGKPYLWPSCERPPDYGVAFAGWPEPMTVTELSGGFFRYDYLTGVSVLSADLGTINLTHEGAPVSDLPPPRLTARHYVAAHLSSAVEELAEAHELSRDQAEPCAQPVQDVIGAALAAARHAHAVIHDSYDLHGATPSPPRWRGSCPEGCTVESPHTHIELSALRDAAEEMATERARPVAGAKLRAVADTPGARAVGRAAIYAGSPPLDPFRQRIDREMADAERLAHNAAILQDAPEAVRREVETQVADYKREHGHTPLIHHLGPTDDPLRWRAILGHPDGIMRAELGTWDLGIATQPTGPPPSRWDHVRSWTIRLADRIDWPRCVPGYARWRRLRARVGGFLHNVVAHPLMGVGYAVEDAGDALATAGEWLHDHTEPDQGVAYVDFEADTGPLEEAMADTKVAVSRLGLGPERAARARAMAQQSGPVSSVDLQPSIRLHSTDSAEDTLDQATRQAVARRVVRDRPQA